MAKTITKKAYAELIVKPESEVTGLNARLITLEDGRDLHYLYFRTRGISVSTCLDMRAYEDGKLIGLKDWKEVMLIEKSIDTYSEKDLKDLKDAFNVASPKELATISKYLKEFELRKVVADTFEELKKKKDTSRPMTLEEADLADLVEEAGLRCGEMRVPLEKPLNIPLYGIADDNEKHPETKIDFRYSFFIYKTSEPAMARLLDKKFSATITNYQGEFEPHQKECLMAINEAKKEVK